MTKRGGQIGREGRKEGKKEKEKKISKRKGEKGSPLRASRMLICGVLRPAEM